MKNLKARILVLLRDKDALLLGGVVIVCILMLIFDTDAFWGVLFVLYGAAVLPLLAVGAITAPLYLPWKLFRRIGGVR